MKTIVNRVNTSSFSKAWLIVALLCIVGCLNYLDRTMITTMRGSIVAAMPMTNAQFGLLTSVFLWVYGVLSPFAGFLADRFNRSRVIIGSLFVWSAVTFITAYTTTFGQLLSTRALMGISEACYVPAALALIADYHRGSTRSLATGIHMTGIMIGSSLGFIGGWMAEKHTWNFVFIIMGTIGMVYSLLLMQTLRDAPKTDLEMIPSNKDKINLIVGVRDIFKQHSFVLLLVFNAVIGVVGWMIVGWLPTYYKEHFNLTQGTAGLYATGYLYSASIIGLIFGGFLADRWSRKNIRGRIFVPVIGLCIAAPSIFWATNMTYLPVAISLFMIYAFTKSFIDANMMPILCLIIDPRYRATGYGVLNFASTITGGIGLYIGGILRDSQIDLSTIYKFIALILLISAMLLLMIKPQLKYLKLKGAI